MAQKEVYANRVQEDVQNYVKARKIDQIVSTLLENIIKYRPTHIATYIIDYIFKNHQEDAKACLSSTAIYNVTTRHFPRIAPSSYSLKGYNVSIHSDIQADLEKFISENRVHTVLTSAVEKLLVTEATNPYAAIIENLCEEYPDQGLLALELINPQKNPAMLSLSKTIATLMKNIDAEIDTDDEGLDDDDDTFDSDYHSKEDNFKSPSAPPVISKRNTTRRFSVSSESLDPATLKDQISKISIIPKDQDTMQRLYQLVSKSPMLRRLLDPEERTLIAKAFAGPLLRPPGEDIIKQGDIGEVFYLLESGNVDVFVTRDGVESKVHTYHDGDAFGQLALMYNAPRAATCRSVTDVKLWTLDRTSFKVIIAGAALRKREMHLAFLNQVQILQSLTEYEKMMLADSLLEEKYADGTAICQEGQYGNDFYIILEGRANAYQKGKDDKEKLVMSYTVGEYFGEIALLTSKPRQATVRAEGEVKLLVIDRPTFNRVFGSMEDVLKRNIELYTKYSNYT